MNILRKMCLNGTYRHGDRLRTSLQGRPAPGTGARRPPGGGLRARIHRQGDRETRHEQRLALEAARKGDVFVVWALDSLARNLAHLIRIGTGLSERGIELRSLKEGIDTTTAAGRFAFHLFGALAEFERARNLERGRAAANGIDLVAEAH